MKLKDKKEKKIIIDYSIDCINLTDYVATYVIPADNAAIATVFQQAKAYFKHSGKTIDVNKVEKFIVPEKFYGTLHLAISKAYKDLSADVKKDGIILNNSRVISATYERVGEAWKIFIKTTGTYYRQ